MDIEPSTMGGRKTLNLIQKNEIENINSRTSNVNRSTIFDFLFFWSIYLLSTSFFVDLLIYFCFYQKKNNKLSYDASTFVLRIISDMLFVGPLLLFIRFALTNDKKYYIVGIFVFLPQLLLSIVSIILVYNQDFITKDDIEGNNGGNNTNNITNITYFIFENLQDSENNQKEDTLLTKSRVNAIKTTPIINLIIYIITVALTYLKIKNNY